MKPVILAAVVAAFTCRLFAAESPRDILALDYAKTTGLVAAAYQGGEVVVWDFESGRVKTVLNAAGARATRNQPLARFSADGKRIAYTAEGDAGLVVHNLDAGSSKGVVPRRLLYLGIKAVQWSRQEDTMLVAIGRDVALVNAGGHFVWQRRLETQSIITDVVWHPNEQSYTVATDDTTVSAYDAIGGQSLASTVLDSADHAAEVKIGWSSDGRSLVAGLGKKGLMLLHPETLKVRKTLPCNCAGFDWGPKKELAASSPSSIFFFTEAGPRRDIKTSFEGGGPLLWADEGHILAAFSDGAVVLRETKTGKVVRTFSFPR